jgi:ABC-type transport system involved in multi-copper enzyme maturation permease subunit
MRQRSASTQRGNAARVFALVIGLGYVAAGLIGFAVTGFSGPVVLNTPDRFLGFFDLNIFHNIVHLAIGLGLLVAWRMRDIAITQGVLVGVGLFYILAALLGFLNYLQLISINTSLSFDNFFHLLTGVVALIFGLIGVRQQSDEPATAGRDLAEERPRTLDERRALWDKEETYREKAY